MTNFEYWKEKILGITEEGCDVALVDGVPERCAGTPCEKCGFSRECDKDRMHWFYAEHKEKPTLTKKERMFCELVETGWIVRDKDGDLRYFVNKPVKTQYIYWCPTFPGEQSRWINWLNASFDFIRWEDQEPWSVEELLKLDVKKEVGESGSEN